MRALIALRTLQQFFAHHGYCTSCKEYGTYLRISFMCSLLYLWQERDRKLIQGLHFTDIRHIKYFPQNVLFIQNIIYWLTAVKKQRRKSVERHSTDFLICNWPWLHYLGNEINCCLLDHCWLYNAKQWWSPSSL